MNVVEFKDVVSFRNVTSVCFGVQWTRMNSFLKELDMFSVDFMDFFWSHLVDIWTHGSSLLEKQKRLFDLDLLDFLDSSDANIFEKVLTTDVSFLSAAFEAGWFLSSFSKTIKVFITARHMQPTSFGLFSVCFVKMFWRGKNIETYFWGRFVWFLVVKEKKDYCSDYSSSDCCSCVLCCTRSSWCSKSFARLSRWGCSVLCSV